MASIDNSRGTPAKVSERLADRLRGEIASGHYPPGALLPTESVLMERYDVGRPSAREALRLLESDGLVRVLRGVKGGAEVLPVHARDVARRAGLYLQLVGADINDVRAARDLVDPGAVLLAADHRDPADIESLRLCIEQARACRDAETFGDVAADFVEALLGASGNHTLTLFGLVLDRILRQEFHRVIVEGEHWADGSKGAWFAAQWTEVVDRIEAGDGAGAAAAWTAHRQATAKGTGVAAGGEPVVMYQSPSN